MTNPPDAAVPQLENTPLAERARAAILSAILEKRFEHRLPSEDDLATMLNVSRTTIRTALQRLEQDGIISRRRAIGTTINAHVEPANLALQRLVGFDRLLEEKGHDVKIDVSWERGAPPADIAVIFDISPEEDCCITRKDYFADGKLAIHIRDYIPWAQLNTDKLRDPIPASMFDFSRRYFLEPIDHAVVKIVPKVNTGKNTTELRLHKGEPFARLHETHYSTAGRPLAFSLIDEDPNYIQLEVFRRG
ncbi:MAG: GntR family transcriptional regulator [Thermoleophilaceae bacterium]